MTQNDGEHILLYVGTYTTGGESQGIYVYRMDASSGDLRPASVATGLENPTFLTIHPEQTYLYAVSEIAEFGGRSSGAVSAFSIEKETAELIYLNQQPSHGPGPCHLSVDKTGKYVLVANYQGG